MYSRSILEKAGIRQEEERVFEEEERRTFEGFSHLNQVLRDDYDACHIISHKAAPHASVRALLQGHASAHGKASAQVLCCHTQPAAPPLRCPAWRFMLAGDEPAC